jgi:NitT/TauT family transport system substrate-binding protein
MKVYLPELSVSHYLLVRGLEKAGLQEKDVTVVNTSDADIVSAFGTSGVQRGRGLEPAAVGYQRHAENHRSL